MSDTSTPSDRAAIFASIAKERRATRNFLNRPLPAGTIEKILEVATHSPSGYNFQPWRFIVVRDPDNKKKLRACAYNQRQVEEAAAVFICCGHTTAWREDLVPICEEAIRRGAANPQYLESVKKNAPAYFERIDRRAWAFKQVGLVAAHILLTAQSMGLSSGPMEGFDEAAVKKAFNIPEDVVVVMLIAVGHGADPKPPFPGRQPIAKIAFGETWSGKL